MQIAAFKVNEIIIEKTKNFIDLLNQAIVKIRAEFLQTVEVIVSAEKISKERSLDFPRPI